MIAQSDSLSQIVEEGSESEEESPPPRRPKTARHATRFSGSSTEDEGYTSDGGHYATSIAGRKNATDGKPLGITLDGLHVFPIPEVRSNAQVFLYRWYTIPSLLTWLTGLCTLGIAMAYPQQPHLIMMIALWWRFCCNALVGILLKWQSEHGTLAGWVTALRDSKGSLWKSAVGAALQSRMKNGEDVLNDPLIPPAFTAWVAHRTFVNFVEGMDVFAFTITALLYGYADRGALIASSSSFFSSVVMSLALPTGDLIGLLLVLLSLYSKLEARRTGGEFAWYWGDFFFLRMGDVELSTNGVFELFPHPTYTVGYGWMYGCSILARSYAVLACTMAIHLSQLAFLTLVEVPHVEKLYSPRAEGDNELSPTQSYSWPRRVLTLSGITKFDITNYIDLSLTMALLFMGATFYLGSLPGQPLDNDAYFVALVLWWHVAANIIKAYILLKQDKDKAWTQRFKAQGKGAIEAYNSWKGLFQLLQCLCIAAFHLCAVRLFWMPPTWWECYNNWRYICQLFVGVMLVTIAVWSFASCYEVLGDYGWCYGDFFIAQADLQQESAERSERCSRWAKRAAERDGVAQGTLAGQGKGNAADQDEAQELRPSYNSIYRYINNPEAYLGHLWMYGYSLICSSYDLMAVAFLTHAMKIAFLQTVEQPHVRQVYQQHVRKHTPLEDAISSRAHKIRNDEKTMFLVNWVKHPIETGALAPSSKQLARAMCRTMYLGDNSVVVELGPGTGPFTKEILRIQGEHKNTTYLAFELSDEFLSLLKTQFPDHADCFLKASAEDIGTELAKRNIQYADTVISGLPWSIFSHQLQQNIIQQVHQSLRPGGRFCTFAYLQGLVLPAGQHFKSLLSDSFGGGNVERSNIVWKNLPPAFVYRCQKDGS